MTATLGAALELDQAAWHGLFPGTVVSTDDPDKGGRVRVRVDQVYGAVTMDEYIPDENLPWARPCYPSTGQQHGSAWAPEVGAAVFVTFWGGDPEKPILVGGWYPPKAGKIPFEFSSSYESGAPRTRLEKTENGHVFEMRWKKAETFIRLTTAAGNEIRLTDDGTEGGTKIELTTRSGYHLHLDDPQKFALLETPGGRHVRLDDKPGQRKAEMVTPNHHVLLDDELLVAEMATPQRRVTLNDPIQFAEMRTPQRLVRLDDAALYAQMSTPTRLVRLDDAAQFAEMITPLSHVKLDDLLVQAEMATPLRRVTLNDTTKMATMTDGPQQVTLDGNVPAINIITPGAVNVTAGTTATVAATGAASVTAGGALSLSAQAITAASTAPAGTALTTAAGLSTSTFTGAAVRNFLGALTLAVTGIFAMTLAGVGSITAVGVFSLFGASVLLGKASGVKQRLVNEQFLSLIFNAHTHVVSTAPGVTAGPSPVAVIGVHTTTDTQAS